MWNIFDQWLVCLAIGWASYVIIRQLTKKTSQCASTKCSKKIFKTSTVSLGRKLRS